MTYNRDEDSRYLLGPFDAERMIRFGSLAPEISAKLGRDYARVQRKFPAIDRNMTYLSWSVEAKVDRSGAYAAHWSRYPDGGKPGFIGVNAAVLATPEGQLRTQEIRHRRDRVALLLMGPAVVNALTDFDRWRRTLIPHEHGHGLMAELTLSDTELNTSYIEQLQYEVASVLPGYEELDYVDLEDLARSSQARDLASQGLPRQAWGSFEELMAETFALYEQGHTSPLISAVGSKMEAFCGRNSSTRVTRQSQLLERMVSLIPVEPASNDKRDARFDAAVREAERWFGRWYGETAIAGIEQEVGGDVNRLDRLVLAASRAAQQSLRTTPTLATPSLGIGHSF